MSLGFLFVHRKTPRKPLLEAYGVFLCYCSQHCPNPVTTDFRRNSKSENVGKRIKIQRSVKFAIYKTNNIPILYFNGITNVTQEFRTAMLRFVQNNIYNSKKGRAAIHVPFSYNYSTVRVISLFSAVRCTLRIVSS